MMPRFDSMLKQGFSAISIQVHGGRSSVGRAPDCDSGRRGFKSRRPPHVFMLIRLVIICYRC